MLLMDVVDDGCGFTAKNTEGVGLISMRERALSLNGGFNITSSEKGTTVHVEIPL